jgi:anti-sigma factor RsiW
MSMSPRQMLECHRNRRRLQRFLDRDPAARLTPAELLEVEHHLSQCERCTGLAEEYRALHRSLQTWGSVLGPDDAAVRRVRAALDRALENEGD